MDKNKLNLTDVASIGSDGKPEAKYTRIGEKIRQTIPGPMQCSMACGGRNCKWENPARWSDADQVIKGVYSSWVLDNVVAMSRPSTGVIKKYDMIGQFKRHNINSIINLQRPGEHASCGPPLDKESLFTYNPKTFMDSNIFFYNFGWKDFGVTSLNTILDMVKVMCFALEEGSVAVHCHAGLGRTGVLIACYLVFAQRLDPGAAILRVRQSRSNSIQTRGQIACVHEFWQFLRPLRIVFPQVVPHSKRLSLKQFLNRQHHLLHGFESRELRYTPKLVHVVCNRLTDMVKSESAYSLGKFHFDTENEKQVKRCNTVADIKETVPGAFVNEEKEEERAGQSSSPTDVEAVLSPRVVRRGSARSRNVSECSNRPSSAGEKYAHVAENVDLNYVDSFGEADDSFQDLNSELVSDSLVLVKGHTPLNSYVEEDNQINENDSEITFVKPQTRAPYQSTVVPTIEQNLTNSEDSEAELDSSSDSGLQFTTKTFHQPNENGDLQQPDVTPSSITLSENSNVNNNSEVATIIEETTLVSPEISPREPSNIEAVRSLVASHTAGIQSTILVESPPHSAKLRKMRLSAGMSETILPTGSRAKSSKGAKSNTVIPGLTKDCAEEQKTDEADNIAEVDEAHEEVFDNSTNDETSVDVEPSKAVEDSSVPKRKKMLLLSELTAHEQNILSNNDSLPTSNDQSNNNNVYQIPLTISDPAMNDTFGESNQDRNDSNTLEAANASAIEIINSPKEQGEEDLEVIDIDETAGPSFSDDENEDENTPQDLMSSMASRVSWTQQMDQGKDESEINSSEVPAQRGLSAASKSSGRQTPLMYRAERNLEMVEQREKRGSNASYREQGTVAASTGIYVDSGSSDSRGTPSPTNSIDISNTKGSDGTLDNVGADVPSPPAGSVLTTTPIVHVARSSKSMNDIASVLLHPDHQDSCPSRRSSYGDVSRVGSAERRAQDKLGIAKAFSYKLTDDEYLWEKIYTQQVAINSHNGAWGELSRVNDPYVLSSLMWSWLEHLETPVLPLANVRQIVDIYEREISSSSSSTTSTEETASRVVQSFEKAIYSLEKGQCCTLKCILECAHSFPPLPSDCSASVIRRTVVALTHWPTSGDVASDEEEDDQSPASCNRKLAAAMQAYIQERYALSLEESADRTTFPEEKLLKPTDVSTHSSEDKPSPQETKDISPSKPASQTDDPNSSSANSTPSSPSSNERKSRRSVGSARSSSSSGSGSNLGNMMQPSIVVS